MPFLVSSRLSTSRTLRAIILALAAHMRNVVEDVELPPVGVVWRQDNLRLRSKFFRQAQSLDETAQLPSGKLLEPSQVGHLGFRRIVRSVEPEALLGSTMHAKRRANAIAELSGLDFRLPRENLNSFNQPPFAEGYFE